MRWQHSGMMQSVIWQKFNDISKALAASIIKAIACQSQCLLKDT
jgi:hypothetical protein